MRPSASLRLVLAFLLLGPAACARRAEPAVRPGESASDGLRAGPKRAFDVISQEEIRAGTFGNVRDLVAALRPAWVRIRPPDTLAGTATPVQAYLDRTYLGTIDALSQMTTAGIVSIEWVDGIEASARWGLNHGQGAIVLHTR